MILVNAENVFPTEVEYRLDAHPEVRESAVVGVEDAADGAGDPRGRRRTRWLDASARRSSQAWCREAMAGYKVPTQWVIRTSRCPAMRRARYSNENSTSSLGGSAPAAKDRKIRNYGNS